MGEEDFEAAVEEARGIEKAAQPYTGFRGRIELAKVIDLNPREFADYSYADLVNLYERAEKIIKTSGMELYGAPAPGKAAPPVPPEVRKERAARTEEVETKVKELTTEALTRAEKIGKELEKPIEKKPELEAPAPEEAKPPTEDIEFERLATGGLELEREKPAEKKPEGQPEIELEMPGEKEIPQEEKPAEEMKPKPPEEKPEAKPPAPAVVPPILRERAEEAATKRYGEIEQQTMSTLGGEVDEASLKKKMLELTKELFKEKSFNRRERIKLEITVIKNTLAKKMKPARKGEAVEMEARGRVLDTIVSAQKTELASTKDRMLTNYKNQVDKLRQDFQEAVASLPEDEISGRKAAFEKMVFGMTSLSEQLPGAVAKYQDFLTEKHGSEVRKLKSSLGAVDEKVAEQADERLGAIEDEYAREFATVRAIVKKQIDAVTEISGRMTFGKGEVPATEAKVQELVTEINETDEGTLLYFLHGKDPEFYKKYERRHLSRQEAIFRAKELMAREKGLSDDMVRKYFSETEG